MVLLSSLTVTWGLMMGRFERGDVYWTMGLLALAATAVIGPTFDSLLRGLLRPRARDVAIGIGAGVLMTAATYPVYWVASTWFPQLEGHVHELYAAATQQESLGVALAWVIVILSAEELLWRAAWIETLRTYLNPRWAALLSLLFYTAAQLGSGSWLVGLAAACGGGVWTALRMWTHSLWPPLLAHLIWTPVVILIHPLV